MPLARTPFVGGNWKMNLTLAGAGDLARGVASADRARADVQTAVFPAFVHLETVARELAGSQVALGAQDAYTEASGAFTGEISTGMLADVGASAVLTGHSERRHVIGESDELVGAKTAAVLAAGMTCVLCVGETLEQREAGQTDAVNERQLRAGLAPAIPGLTGVLAEKLVIAYEPVWAIGTGRTASPGDAQLAHAHLRTALGELIGAEAASEVRIIYGGSMKPGNAPELMAQPDIDGGLIGGASLDAGSFLEIISAASAAAITP